jgi:CRP-like cAMP-binding protein
MLSTDDLKLKLFEDFTADEVDELKKIIDVVQIPAGEAVLRQNQRATNLYIVVSGDVEIIHKPYDAPELLVGRLNSGGVFGWSSILGRDVYSSTVNATSDCVLYRLQGYKLQNFCELHHETGVVLLEKIARSVAKQPAKIHEQIMLMINHAMSCRDTD